MLEDRITKFVELIEDASDDELIEILHEALNAMAKRSWPHAWAGSAPPRFSWSCAVLLALV